jgi:hypothetical protein
LQRSEIATQGPVLVRWAAAEAVTGNHCEAFIKAKKRRIVERHPLALAQIVSPSDANVNESRQPPTTTDPADRLEATKRHGGAATSRSPSVGTTKIRSVAEHPVPAALQRASKRSRP